MWRNKLHWETLEEEEPAKFNYVGPSDFTQVEFGNLQIRSFELRYKIFSAQTE